MFLIEQCQQRWIYNADGTFFRYNNHGINRGVNSYLWILTYELWFVIGDCYFLLMFNAKCIIWVTFTVVLLMLLQQHVNIKDKLTCVKIISFHVDFSFPVTWTSFLLHNFNMGEIYCLFVNVVQHFMTIEGIIQSLSS